MTDPTPDCRGVYVDLWSWSRRDEILAYAQRRGIGWTAAIRELVSAGLSQAENQRLIAPLLED